MRSLDTYGTVRNVITAYYQSRHVTGFRSLSDTGPSPMEIGGVWQRKGMKGGRSKGPHWKGKGKGKYPFEPLKGKVKGKGKWFPLGKGKGKGKSKGGKTAHTGKGKELRRKCWKRGQYGHVEKDCRNVAAVTEENKELYDDWTNDVTG